MQAEHRTVGPGGPAVDAVALARTVSRLAASDRPPWLHEEAARRMADRLPLIKLQPDRVLDWSGPLGASSTLLQAAYPQARQMALAWGPTAQTPIEVPTRRRWWGWRSARPAPIEVLAKTALPAGVADLLWSNMALHGVADPLLVFEQWQRALAAGGFLMFSTLGPGSLPELRGLYRAQGWGAALRPFIDMHDLGDMLVHAGFSDPVMDQELLTLTWPDGAALLRELRSLGANVSPLRHAGLRTPRWRERLVAGLCEAAGNGRPALTFELVYGHAFRMAPRARVQAETAVSLQDMRSMIRAPKR